MSKIAFIFPGQGSQYPGMGKEIIEDYPETAEIMEYASEIINIDLIELCFNGSVEELSSTDNTQPAIYTISYLINKLLNERDIYPDFVAGHSLGEYSALAAAGVFSFEDGLKLVRQRGLIMNSAVSGNKGTMAAIIGLADEVILSICQEVEGICEIANYNSPGQIVISGEKESVKKACLLAEDNGARKTVELAVSGPFHSSLMKKAAADYAHILNKVEFKKPEIPVVANVSADIVTESVEIKELLVKQLSESVRWVESMRLMISRDIDIFVEVGPGKVLKGLLRRIDRSVNTYNVEDIKGLNNLIEKLNIVKVI